MLPVSQNYGKKYITEKSGRVKNISEVKNMCGFAGFCDGVGRYYKTGKEIAKRMSSRLLHRGPDSRGEFSDAFLSVGFCRLEVIDLSGGQQPMLSADGRYLICFNGEIYNHRSIKTVLEEKHGIKFRTSSDTEVLLYACIVYGKEALTHLRGMFSFIFYDRAESKILAARDPFGIKPFYYGVFDGTLLFASEIKAFFPHPAFKKEFNSASLPYYLQFQYVPTEETAFKGVKRLLPGHLLTYDGETLKNERYFCLPKKTKGSFFPYTFFDRPVTRQKCLRSMQGAENALFAALEKSVKLHTVSDVPVGAFLSGGVDSGLICALAKPKTAYSVGFKNSPLDESNAAFESARHIGIDINKVEVSAADFFSALPEVQYHSDEPYANLSAVPLYLLAKRVSSDVKVILSGEGADELFGGYDTYSDHTVGRIYKSLPLSARRIVFKGVRPFGKRLREYTKRNLPRVEERFIGQAEISSPSTAYQILSKKYKSLKSPLKITEKYFEKAKGGTELQKKMYLDQSLWMPFDILNKADKMTMASSVELRVPYLDLGVLAVSGMLSDRLTVRGRTTKLLLRRCAERLLPQEIAYRSKKGFPVPFRDWIKEDRYQNILRNAFESETCGEFFEPEKLISLLDEHILGKGSHARILYTVYAFTVWYDRFFNTPEPSAAVVDKAKEKQKNENEIFADTARLG